MCGGGGLKPVSHINIYGLMVVKMSSNCLVVAKINFLFLRSSDLNSIIDSYIDRWIDR